MITKSFRNVLFVALTATLTCALLIGINIAFGAPTEAPPGSTISPTFDNVYVNSDVLAGGDLEVDGALTVSGLSTFEDTVFMNMGLVADGPAESFFMHDATFMDKVILEGELQAESTSTFYQNTSFLDGIEVSGLSDFNDGIEVSGGGLEVSGGNVNFDENFTVGGNVLLNGPVQVGDGDNPFDLHLYGDLTAEGEATFNGLGDFNDGIWVSGGGLEVSGGNVIFDENFTVSGEATFNANTTVNGWFTVNGKIKATQMGTFRPYSTLKLVESGDSGNLSEGCPAGGFMVSCGGGFSDFDGTLAYNIVNTVDKKCYVGAYNNSGNDSFFEISYVCHEPTYTAS